MTYRTTTIKDIARLRNLARAGYSAAEASREMGRYSHFGQVWARSQSIVFWPGSTMCRVLDNAAKAEAESRLRSTMMALERACAHTELDRNRGST